MEEKKNFFSIWRPFSDLKSSDSETNDRIGLFLPTFGPRLAMLDLSGNQFECPSSPSLFRRIFESSSPVSLILARNQFSCSLENAPAASGLINLDLSENFFSGHAPVIAPDTLGWLSIRSNRFFGPIQFASEYKALNFLDMSENQLSGNPFDLRLLRTLVFLKASHNYLTGALSFTTMTNLETVDMSNNHLTVSPDFQSIGALVQFNELRVIDISNNSLLPTVTKQMMERAGITLSKLSAPSVLVKGAVCAQLTFHGDDSVVFRYDEGLFAFSQCQCDAEHFGSPPGACFVCPKNGKKFCGATALETDRNWFSFIHHKEASNDDTLVQTETCIVTPEQAMTKTTNCKGIKISADAVELNISTITKILPMQCEEGSDGRLCSRCICDGAKRCFFLSGTRCKKCTRVFSNAQASTLLAGFSILLVLFITIVMTIMLHSKRTKRTTPWKNLPIWKRFFYRLHLATTLGNVTILITFLQMIASFTHWDAYALRGVLSLLNGNAEGFGISCLLPFIVSPMGSLISSLLLPIIAVILIGISVALSSFTLRQIENKFWKKIFSKAERLDDQDGELSHLVNTDKDYIRVEYPALALFTSVSISAVRFFFLGTALSAHQYLFSSYQPHKRVKYVQSIPWMRWDEASTLIGVSIPSILLFDLILPLLFLLLCWNVRKSFRTTEVSRYFGSLFETFSPRCFWWEGVNISKKLGVALLLRALPPDTTQSSLIISVLIATLGLQVYLSPWKRRSENFSDTIGSALLILSLHVSRSATIMNSSSGITYYVVVLDAIFALLNGGAIFYLSWTGRTDYHRNLQLRSSNDDIGSFNNENFFHNSEIASEEEIKMDENFLSPDSPSTTLADGQINPSQNSINT